MRDITSNNFGLLIAYVLPGFTVLSALRSISTTVDSLLSMQPDAAPTVAGFLYATLGSIAIGLFISTLRWLLIDRIHHATGVPPQKWDFSRLISGVEAFQTIVDHQYRYYQFYAGMTLAVPLAAVIHWSTVGFRIQECLVVVMVTLVLYLGSRDTLRKYYARTAAILPANG